MQLLLCTKVLQEKLKIKIKYLFRNLQIATTCEQQPLLGGPKGGWCLVGLTVVYELQFIVSKTKLTMS
jgi:hypothetical protein